MATDGKELICLQNVGSLLNDSRISHFLVDLMIRRSLILFYVIVGSGTGVVPPR